MYAEVWLNTPHYHAWTYLVPQGILVQAGDLVRVPFGKRQSLGLVAKVHEEKNKTNQKLRPLQEVLGPDYRLNPEILQLMTWAQSHYLAPPGEVLKNFLPSVILQGKKNQGERAKVRAPQFELEQKKLKLKPDQAKVINQVLQAQNSFYPLLLWGITGSGKTQVYLELCQKILEKKQSALILVPEISLTPQTLGRFAAFFGEEVLAYHSGLSQAQRLKAYWQVKKGDKKIVVGTRSAITLPLKDLSLIVVDEEHDTSYKQEERFRYHARDLAVMRAKLQNIPIVLGSATPSLETYQNSQKGKYHLALLEERATGSSLPKIKILDLKAHPPESQSFLSAPLKEKLKEVLQKGEQALFFIGRRGFAPFLLCLDCGKSPGCPQCSVSLSLHKKPPSLQCHYCVSTLPIPHNCPHCNSPRLKPMGQGTQKIEEALIKSFPHTKIARLDRDIIRQKTKTEEVLKDFSLGKIQILVGTQMITKGHDFPKLSLVGVLLADLNLNFPDFRAAERCFQTLVQVAGRAGRHDKKGEVLIQTYRPHAPALLATLQNSVKTFYEEELKFRHLAHYPPFKRLVLLRLLGSQENKIKEKAKELFNLLKSFLRQEKDLEILGPAPSPLEKIRGAYRYHLLIKSPSYELLQRKLLPKIENLEKILPSSIKLQVDVDPLNLL
ncbi:MAG: primosomal protein N' [Deltaproteobacteria bacterium]|nr:primosomal protein N' [Deltaproteobacteria bacterium]